MTGAPREAEVNGTRQRQLWRTWRWRSAAVALCLAAAVASGAADAPDRIVAVGDVHGSSDGLVTILEESGLIDDDLRWTGGDTTLIQLGDLLDRGVRVREVMDLVMRLQEEAPGTGGEVVCLLGNHEAMNILGLVRDVNPLVYASFTDERSDRRRNRAYSRMVDVWRRRAELLGTPSPDPGRELRASWRESMPLGALEYSQALGPEGGYGRWLRSLPVAVVRGDTLFVHGGVGPELEERDVAAINQRIAREIATFDTARALLAEEQLALPTASVSEVLQIVTAVRTVLGSAEGERRGELAHLAARLQGVDSLAESYLVSSEGPLWYRGAADDDPEVVAEVLPVVRQMGAERIVVAHTPRSGGRIEARLDGRVLLIDTGMLSTHYTGGRPSSLEIRPERVAAIYPGGEFVLQDGMWLSADAVAPAVIADDRETATVWIGPDGQALPFETHEEAVEFLATAEVESSQPVGAGSTRPLKLELRRDGVRAHALFKDVDGVEPDVSRGRIRLLYMKDSDLFEVAAYELDRLLGLDRVPPTTRRRIHGRDGAVQLWIESTITNSERLARGLKPPDAAQFAQQISVLELFDALIGNLDRNRGDLLIDGDWRIWFIDHSRAFTTLRRPEGLDEIHRCERDLWRALRELDEEVIRGRLEPFLTGDELNALLERRRILVERLESLIEQRGEDVVLFDLAEPGFPEEEW